MIYLFAIQYVALLLWAVAFALGIVVTFGEDSVGYFLEGTEPAEWLNVMYNTFARSAWGIALSWLIFACFHGYGGNLISIQYVRTSTSSS